MNAIYEYRLQARRPTNYLALGAGLFTACAILIMQAHPLAWLPVCLYLAIVFWQLWRNPSGAVRMNSARIEVFQNNQLLHVAPLAKIHMARVRKGVFGPDECMIVLQDGMRFLFPHEAVPPAYRFTRELRARGVPLG